MNLLLNLIPIKKGGGQQVASNFVKHILTFDSITPIFLVTEDTYIHKLLLTLNVNNFYIVKKGLLNRFYFQRFKLGGIVRKNDISLIYTMFGPGIHYKNIISVTGCAYSNLFFPEIPFWQDYSFLKRIKLKLIDNYRLKSTLNSDFIVFENEAMQKRAKKIFKYSIEKTALILPSTSEYKTEKISSDLEKRLTKIDEKKFNILMLTGWHKNKNIRMVPFILRELLHNNEQNINFVITVPENHPESIKLRTKAKEFDVENHIIFFDSVKPHEVPFLFEKIDSIALLSLLESFSNNIIEAWHFKKPLIISNQEWSNAICKDAAIYVNRNDAKDIANKLIKVKKDSNKIRSNVVKKGKEIIKSYPTPLQKVQLQLELLKKIHNEKSN